MRNNSSLYELFVALGAEKGWQGLKDYLEAEGYTGHIDKAFSDWLSDQGFTGNYNKQQKDYIDDPVVAIITATVTPATSALNVGQSVDEMTNYATMVSTGNFSSTAGTISSAVVSFGGDAVDATTALSVADTASFSVLVTDSEGNTRTFNTSPITVSAIAPAITGVPTIAGTTTEGQLLTATAASVTGNPTPTRTWQWERSGTPISGATSSTYTLVLADVGETLTVVQTETNVGGSDTAESSATASIAAAPSSSLSITSTAWTTGSAGTPNSLAITHSYSGTDTNLIAVISLLSSATVPTQVQMEAETGNVDETIQVAFTGSPINVASSFTIAGNTNYAVLLKEDVGFDDLVSDVDTGTMTAVDFVAPTLSSSVPADNATGVAITAEPALTFNKAVFLDTGNIVLRDNSGGFADLEVFNVATEEGTSPGQVSTSGSVLTIHPTADFAGTTEHAIRVASGSVVSAQGIPFAGIADDTTLSFTSAAASSYALQEQFNYADNAQANNITGITVTVSIGAQTDVAISSSELAISSGYADIEVEFDGTYSQDNLTEMLITEPGTEASDGQIEICANFSDFDNYYSIGLDYANSNVLFRKGRTGTWDTAISFTAAEAIVDGAIGGSLDLTAASVGTPIVLGVQSTATDEITAYINGVQVSNTVDDSSAPITATGNPNIRISEAAGYTVGEVRLTEL